MSVVQRYPRVPYITSWSAEQAEPTMLVLNRSPRGGIAYADETAGDRDGLGVLWKRVPLARGQGTPHFGAVHSARQRRAMRRLLCQVCAGPADRDENGVLWVIKDHREDWADWPAGMDINEPPICAHCLGVSTRVCPALRQGHAIIRVPSAPVIGVRGARYALTSTGLQAAGAEVVTFDSHHIRWVLAQQLVREIRDPVILN